MSDGMRLNRYIMFLGVLIVVLSMTMATQYATTRATYSFSIAHPSDADIRFIGSDNSSGDNMRVFRVANGTTTKYATISLGDWMPNSKKNYTAAFGIVNEEYFKVNITHVNITGTNNSYITIWLHGDRDADYNGETSSCVKVLSGGTALYTSSTAAWTLGAGNGNANNMNGTDLSTPWDDTSHVRYSLDDTKNAVNESYDFVWVGVSIDIPSDAIAQSATGTIYIHFKSSTVA
jgi:hypothetical protein